VRAKKCFLQYFSLASTSLWILERIENPEIGRLCYLYSSDRNFRLEHFSIFCQMINVYFILLWNISKWLYANLIVLFVWTRYEVCRKKVCTQSWFKNKQFSIWLNKIKAYWVVCIKKNLLNKETLHSLWMEPWNLTFTNSLQKY